MKKEAQQVFGLPDNSPIKVVYGSVIDAQSFPFEDLDSGEMLTLVEYRLKPHLNPDQEPGYENAEDENECFAADDFTTHQISLDENEDVAEAISYLDKAMVYLYANHGINYARLFRDGSELCFAETDQDTMEVENALAVAGAVYAIHQNLSSDDLSADEIYESVLNFSAMINLGDCVRNEKGDVLKFTELLDQSLPEFFGEGQARPDVSLTLHEDYTMTLRYENEKCNAVSQSFKISREGVLDVLEELWTLGKERGYTGERELNLFSNLLALGNNKLSIARNIQFMVPQKLSGASHQKVFDDFLKMETPSQAMN